MYRTLVIARYTFLEAIMQPIYSLMLCIAAAILIIFAMLPFFTLGEDIKMFNSVALDVTLLCVLLSTLFATSKSIYEEIEDRTMLTLMSKPVRRWEVLIGKYLGIVVSAGLAMVVLGVIIVIADWFRVPGDYYLNPRSLNDVIASEVLDYQLMHISGLLPQLVLTWLQISVLAAVGVALSTRFSLVVNLPTVILIYLAGNLTRYMYPLSPGPLADRSPMIKGAAWVLSLLLPYLDTFDLKGLTLMTIVKVPGTRFADANWGATVPTLWWYVGSAALYAIAYSALILCAGLWSFDSRELGGGEG